MEFDLGEENPFASMVDKLGLTLEDGKVDIDPEEPNKWVGFFFVVGLELGLRSFRNLTLTGKTIYRLGSNIKSPNWNTHR